MQEYRPYIWMADDDADAHVRAWKHHKATMEGFRRHLDDARFDRSLSPLERMDDYPRPSALQCAQQMQNVTGESLFEIHRRNPTLLQQMVSSGTSFLK